MYARECKLLTSQKKPLKRANSSVYKYHKVPTFGVRSHFSHLMSSNLCNNEKKDQSTIEETKSLEQNIKEASPVNKKENK